ncbi:MAG: DUF4440 domain-containing protein [Candidatus Zixiibacteriota bacterium]
MRKSLLQASIILMILTLFVTGCGKQKEVGDVDADISAINNNLIQYASSMNAGDLNRWISLWADDAIQMAPDAPAVVGKEQIRAKYESIFPLFIFKMTIANDDVKIGGDLAVSHGNYTVSMTPKAGGETIVIDGKYLSIEERQADGSWKIIRSCFNNNAPPK